MKILGIETSCDETAASVVEDSVNILSNVVVSQIDIFAEYGGVIPEVAARSHLEAIMPVVNKALKDASCTWEDIDAIAVTHAPGLLGSLLVGTLTARTLAILHNKPLYAVHHLKSHVYSNWLQGAGVADVSRRRGVRSAAARGVAPAARGARPLGRELPKANGPAGRAPEREISDRTPAPMFPLIALVVSGGHTQILHMPAHNQFEIIGTTQDDAVGECFDKVAKILGLPYPGGPSIAKAAKTGNPTKYKLPHPKVKGLDFSFSGLKTAVLRAIQKELGFPISHPSHDLKNHLSSQQVADFAASFQKTAVDILTEKIATAIQNHPEVGSVVIAGGVSANQLLKSTLETYVKSQGLAFFCPDPKLSGDNGAMVAAAAYYEIKSGVSPTDPYTLNIYPRTSIENH